MKRRRIWYVPGMISLICLPVLCIWYLNDHKNIQSQLELSTPERYTPNIDYKGGRRFDTTLLSLPENKRKYIEFKLNGEIENDKIVLNSFNKRLLQIIKNNDTINGLHIIIGDNTKYSSFINVIDICKKDSFRPCYAPYDNEFWYFHINTNESIKNIIRNKIKDLKNPVY